MEFALCAPLIIFLIGGAYEVQQGLSLKADLEQAARTATEFALADPPVNGDLTEVRDIAREAAGVPLDWVTATLTCECGLSEPINCNQMCPTAGQRKTIITVTISGVFHPAVKFGGWADGLTVTGNSSVRLQ